jgi:hypothetical protein
MKGEPMHRVIKYTLLFSSIILFGACAPTKLTLKSNPIGADVVLKKAGIKAQTDSVITLPEDIFPKNTSNITEEIAFKKEGYREKTIKNVSINKGTNNIISVANLELLNTKLIIKSEPQSASVTFNLSENQLPEGWLSSFTTPVEFECTEKEADSISGKLKVASVNMEGYRSLRVGPGYTINLPAGKTTSVSIPLSPIITTISVITTPEAAIVEDLTDGGFGYLGETPFIRNFNWEDVLVWSDRQKVKRGGGASFDAITLTLRISKAGYEDAFLKDLKIPIGEERAFRRDLKEIISQIHFASDPDGVHVYVERIIEQEIYDESKKELKRVKVAHKKHLGSTPFTLNIDPNDPLKHGEILIFEKSGYKLATSRYAMGQKSYHQVMVPEVIKER